MNNRRHNSLNPYQGSHLKVLCVCSAGLLRSPTAAHVLHDEYGYNTRAAGLVPDYALIPVDDVLLYWSDRIVCMNAVQHAELTAMLKRRGMVCPVVNLDIPDSFEYMDSRLVKMISENYKEWLAGHGEV